MVFTYGFIGLPTWGLLKVAATWGFHLWLCRAANLGAFKVTATWLCRAADLGAFEVAATWLCRAADLGAFRVAATWGLLR